VLEKLFASITTYFSGAFDSGLFETNDEGYLVNSTNRGDNHPGDFYNLCSSGIELMDLNSFVEGRRFFSKASSITNNLLRSQHPRTLEFVFYSFIDMRFHGYNQIVTLLRIHMRDIATLLFAEGHPWRQLFSQIADIEESHFQFALTEALRCICNMFADSLGHFHRDALLSYNDFLIAAIGRSNDPQLIHDFLIRGEQELGKFDSRIVDIKFSYGVVLYNYGQYAEAIDVLEEVLVRCKDLGGLQYTVADSLGMIVHARYNLGRFEENDEFKLREEIRRIETMAGKFDSGVLRLKTRLEKLLRKFGRDAEAAELQAERNEALGLDDIELENN
jgi:hypothetical protein